MFLLLAGAGCTNIPFGAPKVDLAQPQAPAPQPASPYAGANPYAQMLPPAPVRSAGSLFSDNSFRPGFEDRRARLVGDLVTVNIVENISAAQKSSSTLGRKSDIGAGVSALPFMRATSLAKLGVGANTSNTFEGTGGTESNNTFTGSITATVAEVLPNGHLVLVGEKQVGVNQNVDVLRFTGTVDPRQLQPGSVVSSQQVANARIQSRGRGAQDDVQTFGWLSRFFLSVSPF